MNHAHPPFFQFQPGDWNGFLTLVTDNLAKIVILPAILLGTFQFSIETMGNMIDFFVVNAYHLPNFIPQTTAPLLLKHAFRQCHIGLARCRPAPLEENTVS